MRRQRDGHWQEQKTVSDRDYAINGLEPCDFSAIIQVYGNRNETCFLQIEFYNAALQSGSEKVE